MKLVSLIILCIAMLFGGCKQKTVRINMLPSLASSDSAVVMYYHSPGDPRFFNMIKIKDTNPLPVVTDDVNKRVITTKDTCTTQGKIYFYGKGGAVETIYFSRNKECMTLSFIKTGEKYFTSMSKETMELLDSLEKNVTVLPGRKE
ncbi:MAG: hypothetical protein SGI96_10400 [Bacteroidota bacterium]|nr:hypothetical protein [Bacteroidota bacterium]